MYSNRMKRCSRGRRVHGLVAMPYHTVVILAEPYDRISGSFFAESVAPCIY